MVVALAVGGLATAPLEVVVLPDDTEVESDEVGVIWSVVEDVEELGVAVLDCSDADDTGARLLDSLAWSLRALVADRLEETDGSRE